MNKRKKTRWTSALLGLILAASMVLGIGPKAMAADTAPSPSVTVHDLQGLLSAIETTDAGGIIGVDAEIMVTPGTTLGTFTKGITIQRVTADGHLQLHSDDGTGDPITVNNIVFDGAGVSGSTPFVGADLNSTIEGCTFKNCSAIFSGGGLSIDHGQIQLTGCAFKDNSSQNQAGQLQVSGGSTATLENCTFTGGSAAYKGGAIMNGGTCTITNSTITGNHAGQYGGGIYNYGTLTVEGCKIYQNTADEGGADLANEGNGQIDLKDNLSALVALFAPDSLIPSGWTTENKTVSMGGMETTYTLYAMGFTTPDPTPTPTPDSGNDDDAPTQPSHGSSGGSTTVKVNTPTPVLSCGGAVLDATQTAYLLGYADGLLGQENAVTRAQAAQILYRVLTTDSRAKIQVKHGAFTDVPTGAWYAEAVDAMTSAGIISGCGDSRFNPDGKITWGELATIMARFVDHKPVSHIITTHWAKDALNTAIDFGWIDYTDQFKPDAPVNRGEMVNFISAIFTWAGTQSTAK